MDATNIQKSLSDMVNMFKTTMDEFEGKLHQSQSPAADVPALANEFAIFRLYVTKSLRTLQDQISMLHSAVDNMEMRGRRKILLIHGVSEQSQEDTTAVVVKTVSERLKQSNFSKDSVSRCHRMGRATSDKPRPILCKLRDVGIRDQIWASKSSLKDTGVTLSEFLTKARHETFMTARKRFGIAKCWTRQGFVFVLGSDGTRHRVSVIEDLNKIPQAVVQASHATTTAVAASVAPVGETAAASRPRRAGRK